MVLLVTYRILVERANKGISVCIFGGGDWSFGFEHGIDTTHWNRISMYLPSVRVSVPRFATSVATSNSRWFLISRFVDSPFILTVCRVVRTTDNTEMPKGKVKLYRISKAYPTASGSLKKVLMDL
jgi:hypothetical protein